MKKKILIAEDDADIIELLSLYLKGNDFCVVTASSGLEADKIIHSQEIDLMLLDIMMPKMNGYELIKKLRLENNSLPIIVISAKSIAEMPLGIRWLTMVYYFISSYLALMEWGMYQLIQCM